MKISLIICELLFVYNEELCRFKQFVSRSGFTGMILW